ncbi:glycosyltransferase family 2 protein [Aciditerrimonas ferrireducens]|uniref:glycosyltransferase family 2 protein n=1 Tax=Aciditerrimonas ferrireducens TaxID=667306 RepID=UPI002002DCD9|nr:glycosyltransferase family A protein [Aciditerrimonas ferrireducens]MCK4176835.1 glycosyltransferase [Aciditerrimonas ferrireducens]
MSAPAHCPVSVVLPVHDDQGTLAEALTSACAQTPPPLEVVVVDDGSRDSSVAVVRATATALGCPVRDGAGPSPAAADEPADRPAVVLVQQANAGPSAARNRGLTLARGAWTAFLDADDRWFPGKLRLQLALLAQHPDAVAAVGDWVRQDQPAPVLPEDPSAAPTRLLLAEDLLVLNRFQTSTVLARTDLLRRIGGFDRSVDGVEDWDCWRRLAAHGPIVKADLPLVAYRNRDASYSKDLERVYRAGRRMLQGATEPLDRAARRRLLAWHHLRFAVAFALAGDRRRARGCLGQLVDDGVLGAAPRAAAVHLVPFLASRLRRRLAAPATGEQAP